MKPYINSLLLALLLFTQGYSFNHLTIFCDSSTTITCVFYIDKDYELADSMDVIFDNNEMITDSLGRISIKDFTNRYYSFICVKNNTVIVVDSILLHPPLTKIRLYDYSFENDKKYIDSANSDIKNRKVKIVLSGFMPLYGYNFKKIHAIEKKYGFLYLFGRCDQSGVWLYNYKIFR